MGYWTKVEQMTLEGFNAQQIADTLGMDYEKVRAHIKWYRKKNGISRQNHGSQTIAQSFDTNETESAEKPTVVAKSRFTFKDGVSIYEDELQIIDGRDITPEIIMEAKHLDPAEWEVLSFTKNVWRQQTKDGGRIDLCQSKLSVKPKQKCELTLDDIDRYFAEHTYKPCVTLSSPTPPSDGLTLELCYCDTHMGLLSCAEETGESYDIGEARKRIVECAGDIVERCKGKEIKQIELCLLGDLLHVENDGNTTAKGTPQDTSSRFFAIADATIDTIIDVIRKLSTVAPVRVTWVCGNHSRNSEYLVMRTVQAACSGASFDISPNPIKYVRIGSNAIVGLSHGDAGRKNITNHVDAAARQIGGITHIEQHCGHYHSEMSYVDHGIIVRFLPTICGTSAWEHTKGYMAPRSFLGFLWSDHDGITEYWIKNIG